MEILGFALAALMGITLGLLGGGGSILTVPILVYILSIDPVLATAYSLFVVGTTAVAGAVRKSFQKLVHWPTAIWFALPSLVAVFATRYYIIPALPEEIGQIGPWTLSRGMVIMLFFALVMILAAYSMIRRPSRGAGKTPERNTQNALWKVLLEGAVVGVITGLVGAGGGFLIVPALVLWVGLPIKQAVGTSLVIIAIKSLIGFTGDLGSGQEIEWPFLLGFTAVSVVGMFAGSYLTRFVSALQLRQGFGWFLVIMSIVITWRELASL